MTRTHSRSFVLGALVLPTSFLACSPLDSGLDGVGGSADDGAWWGGASTGGAATGGAVTGGAATGGAIDPGGGAGGSTGGVAGGCSVAPLPAQTYLCAGYVEERSALGRSWAELFPVSSWYACDDGTGGVGTGGSVGTGGWGGDVGTGGVTWGGAGPDDTGADGGFGFAGSSTGGASTGGATGGQDDDWCADREYDENVAGLSFLVDSCHHTDLAFPVRVQEPFGWYELTIYGGDSPCDRGSPLAEAAGYGSGRTLEIPVERPTNGYVSVELVTDDSWSSTLVAQTPVFPVSE